MNEKLQIAVEKAEGANRAKTNFLSNMSHDIRTPMNAILGYNQLMRKKLTDPQLIDYQRKIEQSGSLLLSIINHVLDMSHIESGKMKVDENVEVMETILNEAYGVFASEAAKKEIRMKTIAKSSILYVMGRRSGKSLSISSAMQSSIRLAAAQSQ